MRVQFQQYILSLKKQRIYKEGVISNIKDLLYHQDLIKDKVSL